MTRDSAPVPDEPRKSSRLTPIIDADDGPDLAVLAKLEQSRDAECMARRLGIEMAINAGDSRAIDDALALLNDAIMDCQTHAMFTDMQRSAELARPWLVGAKGIVDAFAKAKPAWNPPPDVPGEAATWTSAADAVVRVRNWLESAAEGDRGETIREVMRSELAELRAAGATRIEPATVLGGENGASQEQLERLACTIGDDNTGKIMQLAGRADLSAEERMRQIIAIDVRFAGKKSVEWAHILRVTASAVRQTEIWKLCSNRRAREDS